MTFWALLSFDSHLRLLRDDILGVIVVWEAPEAVAKRQLRRYCRLIGTHVSVPELVEGPGLDGRGRGVAAGGTPLARRRPNYSHRPCSVAC